MMKLSGMIIPRMFLCCVLLFAASVARADNLGKLQFLYTAYLDVPALFPKTLASCVKLDPSIGPELQGLYDQWYQQHGRYQGELQQLVSAFVSKQVGAAQAQEFIARIKQGVRAELVPYHFPQEDPGYRTGPDLPFCTKLLPRDLTGKGLMLDFASYVEELKKPEPSAK